MAGECCFNDVASLLLDAHDSIMRQHLHLSYRLDRTTNTMSAEANSSQHSPSSLSITRKIRWSKLPVQLLTFVIRSMRHGLQLQTSMRALKFYSESKVQVQCLALAKVDFGKSLSRCSSKNADTRSHVTKDRSLRIAAKIDTKTSYLVSRHENLCFKFALF